MHPTQVYESAASLAIAAVCLLWCTRASATTGRSSPRSWRSTPIARFLLEFLRRDDRGGLLGLSTSQLVGVGLLAAAALLHLWRRPRAKLAPA